jgi:hypothetical protein
MSRTIKEATIKRFHYDSHDQLRTHLADFMAAYNFARRLKTLNGLTPCKYIARIWTSEPDQFIVNPIHQMPGLNTWYLGVGPHLRMAGRADLGDRRRGLGSRLYPNGDRSLTRLAR